MTQTTQSVSPLRLESNESASVLFVRQSLHAKMRAHSSSVNEMVAGES